MGTPLKGNTTIIHKHSVITSNYFLSIRKIQGWIGPPCWIRPQFKFLISTTKFKAVLIGNKKLTAFRQILLLYFNKTFWWILTIRRRLNTTLRSRTVPVRISSLRPHPKGISAKTTMEHPSRPPILLITEMALPKFKKRLFRRWTNKHKRPEIK